MDVPVVRSVMELRTEVATWHGAGLKVALVPTMGALHEGHLTLVQRAREVAGRVVVSIFVNPTQFGPNDDFDRYPRTEDDDRRRLATVGTDLLYAPGVEAMYPPGFSTTVTVGVVGEGLCGDFRPGHFAGVATVVTKLLLQAQPDIALFGEKDYQQLQVIRRLARDLDIPVTIEGVPTVREADGLAMSSRNRYLSGEERRTAAALPATLQRIATAISGGADVVASCAQAKMELVKAGFDRVEYLEVRDAATLALLTAAPITRPARVLVAAWLGRTRLIDNLHV
ncbi:MAG: pantoate--beta-alanine ligase [Alphaproteobacteria bacterium]|nr:pantoate--beta-alanine ligase [Alphaproteobacteria bacterium]